MQFVKKYELYVHTHTYYNSMYLYTYTHEQI